MTKKSNFYKDYDYLAKAPHFIEIKDLTDKQKNLLMESKHFCMLPWVHMHAFPDGRVYPCCFSEYWHSMGDLRRHTMAEVWNHPEYKMLRKNMLEDKPSNQCKKCYEKEENGFFSMRNDSNRNYGHHISEVELTDSSGHHPEFNIRYWDVRFSNLCNFRCRSCGPIFSSNWYSDHIKMYGQKPTVNGRLLNSVEYAGKSEMDIWEQMQSHIPHLEQVYFAGGEPLIMKEHYLLLEKLIELGKTNVRLQYNTNFSELAYKNKHVFEYWKYFTSVSVGASLDASGKRAELMRKGTDWNQIVKNREKMLEEIPHVDFYVSATLSVMNVLHILDFHKEWTDLGLIQAKDFNVNICQGPNWYRIDILPEKIKQNLIIPKYLEHIEWLQPQDSLQRAMNGFTGAINFMQAKNDEDQLVRFLAETEKLDQLRKENFWETFPELAFIKDNGTT